MAKWIKWVIYGIAACLLGYLVGYLGYSWLLIFVAVLWLLFKWAKLMADGGGDRRHGGDPKSPGPGYWW